MDELVVYGSGWCGFTVRLVRQLQAWDIPFQYVDVDEDPAAEKRIADWNNGRSIRPTVQLGEKVWVNPSPAEVRDAMEQRSGAATT